MSNWIYADSKRPLLLQHLQHLLDDYADSDTPWNLSRVTLHGDELLVSSEPDTHIELHHASVQFVEMADNRGGSVDAQVFPRDTGSEFSVTLAVRPRNNAPQSAWLAVVTAAIVSRFGDAFVFDPAGLSPPEIVKKLDDECRIEADTVLTMYKT